MSILSRRQQRQTLWCSSWWCNNIWRKDNTWNVSGYTWYSL